MFDNTEAVRILSVDVDARAKSKSGGGSKGPVKVNKAGNSPGKGIKPPKGIDPDARFKKKS